MSSSCSTSTFSKKSESQIDINDPSLPLLAVPALLRTLLLVDISIIHIFEGHVKHPLPLSMPQHACTACKSMSSRGILLQHACMQASKARTVCTSIILVSAHPWHLRGDIRPLHFLTRHTNNCKVYTGKRQLNSRRREYFSKSAAVHKRYCPPNACKAWLLFWQTPFLKNGRSGS